MRVPAVLTRAGVFTYQDEDGKVWSELRPPEEVFAADSLATLRDATVTEMHPPGPVTKENWDAVSIGHLSAPARQEGDRLVVTDGIVVQSGPAVDRVLSKDLREVSCGYSCDIDETPGVYDDQPYTRVQRGIRYDHIALGPEGWARGGREIALRMDGAAAQVQHAAGAPAKDDTSMKTITIKGRTFRLDDASEMAEAQKTADAAGEEIAAHSAANTTIAAELAATKTALVELAQKLSALEVKVAAEEAAEKTPAAVTEDMVPEEVQDSIVAKRGALLVVARAMLPKEVKLDGLKATEIKRKVVAHAHPTVRLDGLSDDTVQGLYLAATTKASEQAARREDGQSALSRVFTPSDDQPGNVTREDGEAVPASVVLQRKLEEAGHNPLIPTTKVS